MLNHQGTASVLVPWAYTFVEQNLISFEGNSNAAQRPALHSFCCAIQALWLEGKMLSSSASVLGEFWLIGLKPFSLHFTPLPSFHPPKRNGRRNWSFSSMEKGVQWGLAMDMYSVPGEQDLKWYYLSFLQDLIEDTQFFEVFNTII